MIKRRIFSELLSSLPEREFTLLVGARQTGKSTLLRQLYDQVLEAGQIAVFLNLERKNILLDLNENPERVFQYLPQGYSGRAVVFMDEIQYLHDSTHFLKLLFDEYASRVKVVATGSSAFYLHRDFTDSLAGRKRLFQLPTLDFEEFLLFTGQEDLADELELVRKGKIAKSTRSGMLWSALETYALYGGYPAVVLEPDPARKVDRLYELRDAFVKRDMLESGITDEAGFFRFMTLLAGQTGSLLNLAELGSTLRLSSRQVEAYIHTLQTCFHIALVRPYVRNLRKELTKMPKAYFLDLGLRNALIRYFAPLDIRPDRGELFENLVFRRLYDRYPLEDIHFWRTSDGHEVDFVVDENAFSARAWEVKFSASAFSPGRYAKFTEAYPHIPLSCFSWGDDSWWANG